MWFADNLMLIVCGSATSMSITCRRSSAQRERSVAIESPTYPVPATAMFILVVFVDLGAVGVEDYRGVELELLKERTPENLGVEHR